ncbi:MAG: hypothetical protein QM754_18260 [Tepidisphaeraceae bacterium]
MIDLEHEKLIDLEEAGKHPFLRDAITGKAAHVSKVYRGIKAGFKGRDGQRHKLEAIVTPTGQRTTNEAILRLAASMNAEKPAVSKSKAARQAAANKTLKAAGVLPN